MQLPAILKESRSGVLQGAIAGGLATALLGFNWGGWTEKHRQTTGCEGQYRHRGCPRPDVCRQVWTAANAALNMGSSKRSTRGSRIPTSRTAAGPHSRDDFTRPWYAQAVPDC
jgi:hypothetical protein